MSEQGTIIAPAAQAGGEPAPAPAPGATPPAPAAAPATQPATQPAPAGEGAPPPAAQAPTWPEDWRQQMAGEDKEYLKTLERFASPNDLAKSYREARTKLSSGQLRSPLPDNPTPEQLTAWRAENGIPETPDKYEEKLPNGVVLGVEDKPLVDAFRASAHAANMTPSQYNQVLGWYLQENQRQQEIIAKADDDYRQANDDMLHREWGHEYRQNVNGINNLLALAPNNVAARLLGGRTSDGQKIGNDPDVIRWLSGMARELNPVASVMPAGTMNAGQAMNDEISKIENLMRTDNTAYWKDQKMQERYRELLTARDKHTTRQ